MLDWLRLIRASGLLTIVSNSIAGVLVCNADGHLNPKWMLGLLDHGGWRVLLIPLASFMLFASGMLWNDLNDIDRDRVLNPRRPLPSGRVGLAPAYVVGVILAVGALVAGYLAAGKTGFQAAGVVLTLIFLYDFAAKDVPYVGSLVMGLVRASHAGFVLLLLSSDYLKMALQRGYDIDGQPWLLAYPLILGLYIFGLTLVSELESRRSHRWELLLGGSIIASAIGLAAIRVCSAHWIKPLKDVSGVGPVAVVVALAFTLGLLVALVAMVARPYLEALRTGKQALVGATVFAGLGGIILLDALVAASAHPLGGLVVLALFPIFRGFGSLIRMD